MLKYLFYILLFLLYRCNCIGFEYYDDRQYSSQSTQDVTEHNRLDSRRHEKLKIIAEADNKKSVSTVKNNGDEPEVREISSKICDNNCFPSINTVENNKIIHAVNNVTILPSDITKEYEYIYDDDVKPQILRDHNMQKWEQETKTNLGFNTNVPVVEFYNLEPAVKQIKVPLHSTYLKNNNIWYSLENLPCWDLPLLYGEFGIKKKTSEVFLMDSGKLKNVFEKKYKNDWFSANKPLNMPLNYYTSKWCTVEPCYGDHTLCLFSDSMMSHLCDEMYKVIVPNVLEQTTLLNTLNSMRNKIANGISERYLHLPPAANMKQVIYDYDLQKMAKVWLYQCVPGPAPCSALDGTFVTQLECTKYAKDCCIASFTANPTKCTPKPECSLSPVIGCLHVWFWNAGENLTATDVKCGHTSVLTYSTVQLLWAKTYKIGCAYAQDSNGDVRVICNFSPGAPFMLDAKLFCGIIGQKDTVMIPETFNLSDDKVLLRLGLDLQRVLRRKPRHISVRTNLKFRDLTEDINAKGDIDILSKIYQPTWIRNELKDFSNGTKSMIARLVVKYEFMEQNGARCDSDQPIYVIGTPGSLCVERGRRYKELCYDYRDPTPGYRLVAILAPIALFSLILYDLFSGVVRQTNY